MAGNDDIRRARAFHDETTHTPWSVRTSGHTLDWDIKPLPFKIYADLPARLLPREFTLPAVDTLRALDADPVPAADRLGLETLAALLYFTAGVTRKKTYPGGGEVLFRAAPSTGALYQTEVYVAAGAVEGLEPGLYHFNPGDFALRPVRGGDVRAALAAAGAEPALARRAATVVLTAIYWRNTWKYRARGWRHLYWDGGTMLANLLATGAALGLRPRLLTGFVDAEVNRLLGIDVEREAALAMVALGPEGAAAPPPPELPPVAHVVVPLSAREVDYPDVAAMQRASSLENAEAVRAWRARPAPAGVGSPPASPSSPASGSAPSTTPAAPGDRLPLPPPRRECGRPLHDTIQHRGSSRRFRHDPLTLEQAATALWWATRWVEADVPGGLVTPFVIVHAVEGVEPGAWRYRPAEHALELVRLGRFRSESAYLCLEQALGGDAALVLYFLAPLDALLRTWGNRGYRLANLQAGLAGGRAYLAAYGQRFGATGLTFYDRLVVEFFAPASEGLDAVFVTALGRPGRVAW
jgi:SagB-type dehydrogenase family enzyme